MKRINQMEPSIGKEEKQAMMKYLDSGGWLTEYKKTREFEQIVDILIEDGEKERDKLAPFLDKRGIGTRPFYPAIHSQLPYSWVRRDFKNPEYVLNSWGHNKEMKPLIEAEIRKWIKAGYGITSINHRDELDIERAWSPQELNKLYSNKDKNLYTLYDKIRDLAKTHDVYHPDFIKSLKDIYIVIVSGDDPESSDYCSKPYVHAFDHAFAWGVNFDRNTKITEKLLKRVGFKNIHRYDWRKTVHKDYDDFSQAYIPHMDKEHGILMSLNVECEKM